MKLYLSPRIKWATFKKIYNTYPDSGPTPVHFAKMLWNLLHEKRINIFITPKEMYPTIKEIPKGAKVLN